MINFPILHLKFVYRELLLLTGISTNGIGNWKKIAEHVGTRTKEEVEAHYREVYIESENWPKPVRYLFFLDLLVLSINCSVWTEPLISTLMSSMNANDGEYPL